jgi:DNA topoisomerase-1
VQTAVLKIVSDNDVLMSTMKPFYKMTVDFDGVSVTCTRSFDTMEEALAAVPKQDVAFSIKKQVCKKRKDSPSPAFTTSSLQQMALQKYGFSIDATMKLAQNLYEKGCITYIRTTSTHVSDQAKKRIFDVLGVGANGTSTTEGSGAEAIGAHEAIRPTFCNESEICDGNEKKLYDLIYNRTLRSFTHAKIRVENTIEVCAGDLEFVGTTKDFVTKELGQVKAYSIKEHWPHSPYTEGSLIKMMEDSGIGRPSTFVSTLERLYKQEYIEKIVAAPLEKVWDGITGKLVTRPGAKRTHKILRSTPLGVSII